MGATRERHLNWRTAALSAALFAIVLRALIPAGWMPALDSDGRITIEICTIDGLSHVGLSGDDANGDDAADLRDLCPFVGAAFAAVLPAPVPSGEPAVRDAAPSLPSASIAGHRATAPPGGVGARAPPFASA